uniref:uncharacterized protein LOC122596215 n=1 Tax=Erigeron canadensis TaxID=72917 RepID=UPI001CB8E6D6|nr:uncharacterized protein LOC122596215 [Erigeron canadensis]
MVFNSVLVVSTAIVSTDVWQSIAGFSDRITIQELLNFVICFPLEELGQFAHSVWNFFCLPTLPANSYFYSHYYNDSEDGEDSDSFMSSTDFCFSGYDPYSDNHSD